MSIIKRLIGIILIITGFLIQQLHAQPNLVLENMTITTTQTFNAASSITAGPNFTITGSGNVTFGTPNVDLIGNFVIESGGQFTVLNGPATGIETAGDPAALPTELSVGQNYPNPFNPATRIRYALPRSEKVEVVVYDVSGQAVKSLISQHQPAGYHTLTWDGKNDAGNKVSSGLYYYRVVAGKHTVIKKMILLR
ncbi:MAG: T9SS type A sorting domain-containing protein [Aliifodinibius sp.]|nr:T9SS type A sorting domain-containing protein [Fodinibius sp.]NIV16129.1 T9SS type A sorting domain-containing protein [Fodinibius sp.]NIY30107.1 T9SS type A sorting domain-containing protein [Fodinibius sp.]